MNAGEGNYDPTKGTQDYNFETLDSSEEVPPPPPSPSTEGGERTFFEPPFEALLLHQMVTEARQSFLSGHPLQSKMAFAVRASSKEEIEDEALCPEKHCLFLERTAEDVPAHIMWEMTTPKGFYNLEEQPLSVLYEEMALVCEELRGSNNVPTYEQFQGALREKCSKAGREVLYEIAGGRKTKTLNGEYRVIFTGEGYLTVFSIPALPTPEEGESFWSNPFFNKILCNEKPFVWHQIESVKRYEIE